MGDYVSSSEVSNFGHEFAALVDASDLLTAASRLFDNLVEVSEDFFAVGDISAPIAYANRDFIGNGTAYLKLDPYIALSPTDPIMLNDGTVEDPDYTIVNVPDHVIRNGSLVVLDRTLRFSYDNFFTGINRYVGWPDGMQIRVSANWGFSAIPADVKLACIHLAFQLWRTADPSFSIISGIEGAQVATFRPAFVAQSIIDKYRARYSQKPLFV